MRRADSQPALASYQPLDLVRVRPITADPSTLPASALNSNVVAFDTASRDAQLWSREVASIGFDIKPIADRDPTASYIETFICRGAPADPITRRIYFQIANTTQESLARFGISALKQIDASAYVSDSVELVRESPRESQVRFYAGADADAASAIATAMTKLLKVPVKTVRPDIPNPPSPGTFEIWLGKAVDATAPDFLGQRRFWRETDVTSAVSAVPLATLKRIEAPR